MFKFITGRFPRLCSLVRLKGIGNGWWLWKVENNLILDIDGTFIETLSAQFRQISTKNRWSGDDETADSILEFIENMKNFRKNWHD